MRTDASFDLTLGDGRHVYSVSALNREARSIIETGLGTIWVEGEISNLARPASGHLYWSMKDDKAQIRCAMFRQFGTRLRFAPRNGQQVLVRARASIYEARGEFQLIVEYMEDAGEGALRRKFEELKEKLAAEGLFDETRKKPLPRFPSRIGVITSATGAAIRDVLTALKRRFPAVRVLIYPSSVQGANAGRELADAVRLADARAECDLLIVTRGGGSLEDLWAFNEEVLARAIAAANIPIVAGVGHETDFTIADFVADLRAPTPSQAAELAVPNQAELMRGLLQTEALLARAVRRSTAAQRQRLGVLAHRLDRVHPGVAVREREQRLDDIEARLGRALRQRLSHARARFDSCALRLKARDPRNRIALAQQRRQALTDRLRLSIRQSVARARNRFDATERALRSLSPLATLERGYSIVTLKPGGRVATSVAQLTRGDEVDVRLFEGGFTAAVKSTSRQEGKSD